MQENLFSSFSKTCSFCRVAARMKMVAFKGYGSPKNVPKNAVEKKKRKCCFLISQVNNEPPCVLFERTSNTAK